jgi:hypothetical protein
MDVTQIAELLGLAGTAVGTTEKAATTIKSIKALFEGGKSANSAEAADLLNILAGQLTAAKMTNVQLSEALRTLSQQLQRENEFEVEKRRYEMFKTRSGDIVFRLREETRNGQPMHYICPVCLNKDKLISYVTKGYSSHACQTNRDHFYDFGD